MNNIQKVEKEEVITGTDLFKGEEEPKKVMKRKNQPRKYKNCLKPKLTKEFVHIFTFLFFIILRDSLNGNSLTFSIATACHVNWRLSFVTEISSTGKRSRLIRISTKTSPFFTIGTLNTQMNSTKNQKM